MFVLAFSGCPVKLACQTSMTTGAISLANYKCAPTVSEAKAIAAAALAGASMKSFADRRQALQQL